MSEENALRAAFVAHLGPVEVASHTRTPWHSATFSGTRHAFTLVTEVTPDKTLFLHALADAEIHIPCGFVADVAVCECPSGDKRRLNVEVLTIAA